MPGAAFTVQTAPQSAVAHKPAVVLLAGLAADSEYAYRVRWRAKGGSGDFAQGPTRRARGEAYQKYVEKKTGAKQPVVIVPLCGHNARCMFTADVATPVLYPKVK